MDRVNVTRIILGIGLLIFCGGFLQSQELQAGNLQPVPDKLVVLTFDDGCKSDVTFAMPLLKKYGFGATFFITEGWRGKNYLNWQDVKKMHDAGFEIGNHTKSHPDVTKLSKEKIRAEIEYIEQRCKQYGIAVPRTFCYPGFRCNRDVVEVLREKGYLFARRGVGPEFPDKGKGARGPEYDPGLDHPLLIPCTGYSGPDWGFEDFVWAVKQAHYGRIAVLTFHGVPDIDHPWVHTDQAVFKTYMDYLRDNNYTVIAMRDLAKYVDPAKGLERDPFAPMQKRIKRYQLNPTELRCEYAANPLGLDVTNPRFSWILKSEKRGQMQSAYRIMVASSEKNLKKNHADLWDSGKVASDKSVNVTYQGKPLSSGQKCWWKVICWGKQGKVSTSSAPATFEMGLLKKSDWKGKWIGTAKDISSPLLRKEFTISKKAKKARVYMSGLGWSELYIKGKKIGDHVLDPATTYYNNDQSFELGSRVLYVTYDVTEHLKKGRNAIGVMLGNGWYSDDGKSPGRERFADRPKLILQMNMEFTKEPSLSIVSDDTWKNSSGPITANEICLGEHYDARLEKTGWNKPGYDDERQAGFPDNAGCEGNKDH